MASVTMLNKAIAALTKATEEECNKNYEEALRVYNEGIYYYLLII